MSGIFLDTNILLYTLDIGRRSRRAREAILEATTISVQVLNEFANVVRKKRLLNAENIQEIEAGFRNMLHVVPLTVELHDAALRLNERYEFSFYDALIMATAIETGCDVLYTEGLQHGQLIERTLRVVNPFRE